MLSRFERSWTADALRCSGPRQCDALARSDVFEAPLLYPRRDLTALDLTSTPPDATRATPATRTAANRWRAWCHTSAGSRWPSAVQALQFHSFGLLTPLPSPTRPRRSHDRARWRPRAASAVPRRRHGSLAPCRAHDRSRARCAPPLNAYLDGKLDPPGSTVLGGGARASRVAREVVRVVPEGLGLRRPPLFLRFSLWS